MQSRQPLCASAQAELVIPQQMVYLNEVCWLCVVRDVTLDRPGSQQGTVTFLQKPVAVSYSPENGGRYVLAEDHPVDVEGFFYEPPTQEDREKHPRHREKNIYWGGCHFCNCEQEAKETELLTRKVTHVSYQEPVGIGDFVTVRGLVEHAQTQEDLVWVLYNFKGDLAAAKGAVALNPLAKDAIWLDEEAFQALVDALPPGRRGVSFVDFGTPGLDSWAM